VSSAKDKGKEDSRFKIKEDLRKGVVFQIYLEDKGKEDSRLI
jgi:hypothetical protein